VVSGGLFQGRKYNKGVNVNLRTSNFAVKSDPIINPLKTEKLENEDDCDDLIVTRENERMHVKVRELDDETKKITFNYCDGSRGQLAQSEIKEIHFKDGSILNFENYDRKMDKPSTYKYGEVEDTVSLGKGQVLVGNISKFDLAELSVKIKDSAKAKTRFVTYDRQQTDRIVFRDGRVYKGVINTSHITKKTEQINQVRNGFLVGSIVGVLLILVSILALFEGTALTFLLLVLGFISVGLIVVNVRKKKAK